MKLLTRLTALAVVLSLFSGVLSVFAAPAPIVVTNPASAITITTATLNGNLLDMGTASTVNVYFEYGTATSYGHETSPRQIKTTAGTFSVDITGLDPATTYHFRAMVDDGSADTATGGDITFTTATPLPPDVNTLSATNVTTATATLNGFLESLGSAPSVDVYFEYGIGTYNQKTSAQTLTATGGFTADIAGLTTGALYQFRTVADGGIHGITSGPDMTFSTAVVAPTVNTISATNITINSVTLIGELASLGSSSSVYVSFEYGLTAGYGLITTQLLKDTTGTFIASITGLTPGTTYHFAATANGGASGIGTGVDMTFTTLTATAPSVTTSPATALTNVNATLVGNLTSLGTATTVYVAFEYGPTAAYGTTTSWHVMTGTGTFMASIDGLLPATTYHFRVIADGGDHGTTLSGDATFTTLTTAPPIATTSSATNITKGSATLNGNLTSLGTAASVNVYFEYGVTTAYGNTTPVQPKTTTGAFSANISGLSPGVTYHFRVIADGGASGSFTSPDTTFTTGTNPPIVTASDATNVTSTSVTLHGNLVSLGSADTVNVFFEYGTASGIYGSVTVSKPMTGPGAFSATITGLSPNMVYYFRAKADGGAQGIANSNEKFCMTAAPEEGQTPGEGQPPEEANLPLEFTGQDGWKTTGAIDPDGYIQGRIQCYSPDGLVTAVLPNGTRALDSNGQPISELSISLESAHPQLPDGTNILGYAHNFQPNGASFNPSITLSWTYDPADLPEGVNEEDLLIAFWDETNGRWIFLSDVVIDTATHTITASVNHFTVFAVFYHNPARLTYSAMTITPSETDVGQDVTISLTVHNLGNMAGNYSLTLKIDDVEEATKSGTVEPGASQEVTFQVVRDTAGTYQVSLNGSSGSFIITENIVEVKPASFTISQLSVTPATVSAGTPVTVSLTVTNSGETAGKYFLLLKVNNTLETTKQLSLNAGESQQVSFEITKKIAGSYEISIGSNTAGFVVESKPLFSSPLFIIGIIAAVLIVFFLYLLMRKPKLVTVFHDSEVPYGTTEEYEVAIKKYTEAIQENAGEPFVYRDRGVIRLRKGDYVEALKDLSSSIYIFPRDPRGYFERGNLYKLLQQYENARNDFNTVVELNVDPSLSQKARDALSELQ
ncbi:MAG: hypothetical protein JW856_03590 [Dehalococcoidales bacterium]|nr:hypothetical protein [Dehalococcoidales bacterium]